MKKIIDKVKNHKYIKSFEERTKATTNFSWIKNFLFGLGKITFGIIVRSSFFCMSGAFNFFMGISRKICYEGLKKADTEKKVIKYNIIAGISVIVSGLFYITYMIFTVIYIKESFSYPMGIGVMIAFFSFLEFGISIKGVFSVKGKNIFYKDIKLINLSSAFTSIMLTQIALLSVAQNKDTIILNGYVGAVIGVLILLIGVFIIISPKVYKKNAILRERRKNRKIIGYSFLGSKEEAMKLLKDRVIYSHDEVHFIELVNSKISGAYLYRFDIEEIDDNVIIKGEIKRIKTKREFKLITKVLLIVLFIVYIWFYMFINVFSYVRIKVRKESHKKLDQIMIRELDFQKMDIQIERIIYE